MKRFATSLLLFLCFLLFTAISSAGPVPVRKEKPPVPVVATPVDGTWTMEWQGGDWHTTFDKDGKFHCQCDVQSTPWVGTWSWDAKTSTLTVKEAPAGNPAAFLHWDVQINVDLTGKGHIRQGGELTIKLTRPKPTD